MNVLLISTHDQLGGAAIAAYRLLEALNRHGVNAKMLVQTKTSTNENVYSIGKELTNKFNFIAERGSIFIHNSFSKKNLFDISLANTGNSITDHHLFKEADIIHLHWINQGMLSLKEIKKIATTGKKIVWTMHDMWPITGVCHHAGTCIRYRNTCGLCPYLVHPYTKDISYRNHTRKKKAYSKSTINFVTCSKWLEGIAKSSSLALSHRVSYIPNTLNQDLYKPKDKADVRIAMGIPLDKKVILFAAAKLSDKRKGIDYLIKMSKLLSKKINNYIFLIAGSHSEELIPKLYLPVHDAGYLSPNKMVDLYNAADVFVTPSLQENLPNTIMESLACGTPCVGFDIGGIPEMIDHKVNGYVAKYKDAQDLANGLKWVLDNPKYNDLAKSARAKVNNNYSERNVVDSYLLIYETTE